MQRVCVRVYVRENKTDRQTDSVDSCQDLCTVSHFITFGKRSFRKSFIITVTKFIWMWPKRDWLTLYVNIALMSFLGIYSCEYSHTGLFCC